MSESLTLYKLIVLYMLSKVNFAMNTEQICDFILTQGYTDYFKVQQTLAELRELELVHTEVVRNNTYYKINEAGLETVHLFDNKISKAIKADIHQYLKKNAYEMREEASVLADYDRTTGNEYLVHLRVLEQGENLVEVKLRVATEEAAALMCNQWKSKNQSIYAFMMQKLLSDE